MNTYRRDIQIARGLAVLAVVLYHANLGFHLGYLGVNLFFVISGYVTASSVLRIAQQSRAKQFRAEFLSFIELRFYRLFPAYFFISIFGLFLITIFSIPEIVRKSATVLMFSPVFLANIVAYKLSNNYFSPQPSGFLHYWSLSVEEQIYILIPFASYILLKIVRSRYLVFIGIALISLLTWLTLEYSSLLQQFGISDRKGLNYYLVTTYIWQYCVGLFAYLLKTRITARLGNAFRTILWAFSSAFLLIIIFGNSQFLFVQNSNLNWLLTSLLGFLFLISGGMINQSNYLLKYPFKILEQIGNASYSIYLIHFPMLFLFFTSPIFSQYRSNHLLIWCVVLLSILLGIASYRKIENRFRRKRPGILVLPVSKKWVIHYLTTTLSIILLCTLSVVVGGNYWSSDTPKVGWRVDQKIFDSKAASREVYLLDGELRSINRNKSDNLLLLAGDSHAGALASSLISNFSGDIDLLLKSGCPLAQSTHQFSCPGFGESVIKQSRSKKYEAIILTNRFNQDLDYLRSFEQFYTALKSASKAKIIVVGPVPEILDSPRIGGAFWQSYGSAREFPLTASSKGPIYVNKELLRKSKFSNYIDSMETLCPSGICKLWDSTEGWLYNDQNHLSISGSNILMKKIISKLDSI